MVHDMDHMDNDETTTVCLIHGEPLCEWNGHLFCPACDARDGPEVDDRDVDDDMRKDWHVA